jgi:hypothetical protein
MWNKHIQSSASTSTFFSWFHFLCVKQVRLRAKNNTQYAAYARPGVAAQGRMLA